MGGPEILIALNAALGLVTQLAQAYQNAPDGDAAVKAKIAALVPAVTEANDAVQAYKPLPPPTEPPLPA